MMEWTENLSCGYKEIDEQHKGLIDTMNKIEHILITESADFSNLLEVATELHYYIERHFSHEESLMKKYNYPDMERHIQQHDGLRLRMKDLNILHIEDREAYFEDTLSYLTKWLEHHIMEIDKKFVQFILA